MCQGVKLSNVCNVENVVQCQKKCNEIYDCAHLSYDRKKKVCRLYNTCKKLKSSFTHSSYSKKSLLRNNGYNIYNSILLYMKGSPYEPKCGFSAKTVQALIDCGAEFTYVDILDNQEIRQTLPNISDWPTFPQLFVSGELIGGCDIITEMHEAGELQSVIEAAS